MSSSSETDYIVTTLFQDLAIVPLMALLTLFATDMSITQDVGLAVLESVLIIIGVFMLGRTLMRPAFQLIAGSQRNPEIFEETPSAKTKIYCSHFGNGKVNLVLCSRTDSKPGCNRPIFGRKRSKLPRLRAISIERLA